jgi:D-amino-acid dehydrogenase
MKVIIVGAGVIGVTTAWYLAKRGHDVTVLERRSGPALETSFANAGGVCPGFAGPWASPGMPLKGLKSLFKADAPFKLRPKPDPAQWRWLAAFLANCTTRQFAHNKARMQRMAHYSKAQLVALREETGIAYDDAAKGVLQIFCTQEEMAGGQRAAAVLAGLGVTHVLLEPEQISAIEPSLDTANLGVVGGLHLPTDETGDCHLFTRALSERLARDGTTFQYGCEAQRLVTDGRAITAIETSHGAITADAYVVAGGPFVVPLLRTASIDIPIYPVKGYSMTCPIIDDAKAPVSSVFDDHSKVMICRLGNRVRAAGVAEIAGFDPAVRRSATNNLRRRVKELFPGAADYDNATFWCGFRAMTPDGVARIGPTHFANLYLNCGHGSNGWTQACGTARVLTDMMSGREPEIAL